MKMHFFGRVMLLTVCLIALTAGVPTGAHPLAQWHQRLLLSGGSRFFADVTWGGERFVAVGNGFVATSTNGADWNVLETGISGFFRSIAHGNGLFVAVGLNGVIMSSPDGTNWSPHALEISGAPDLYDLSYGSGLFVAVGESGRIFTSPDGSAWAPQISGSPYHFYHLTHGGGRFLLPLSPGTNLVSDDGFIWLRRPSGTPDNLYTVGFGGGRFVSVDTRLKVWSSPDAVEWSPFGSITGIRPPEVGWGNGQFVILANPAPEYAGTTGAWTRSATNIAARGVAFGQGTFVLTADSRIFQSDPIVHLEMPAPGSLKLAGPRGNYRILVRDALAEDSSWQSVTNLPLVSSPLLWVDPSTGGRGRLYQAILDP